ncbi:uncharacterized protein LOC119067308 isoform X2 [Bradysia coprophila]|uniref:uncharacterized protein LOC119067308 isoform X2 n=1 Tax=Bradysia coprophila TaxID=38358 RepID=UPI00187D7C50|nr:uncharacterized protein LOC119067308 isoform X2 [Bradysia coprophila]
MANTIQIVLIFAGFNYITALQLTEISVPEIADFRDPVTLSCSYNMGSHTLNSVKWYKNNQEFFRYTPLMYPSIMKFNVDGVTLAEQTFHCNKVTCSVNLAQLGPRTSGLYRCEISGDAPEFKLEWKTGNMTIAALPKHDPVINGLQPSYQIGDFVTANCSSDRSSPAASLYWYIGDEKVPPDYLQPQHETSALQNEFNLRYRTLEIRFLIDKERFGLADDVANQKLINNNWKNSASNMRVFPCTLLLIYAVGFVKSIYV